jgi:GNAT superfamily N-acetyltransferase
MNIRNVKPNEWKALQELNNEVFVDNAKYDPDIIRDWAFTEAGKKYYQELVNDLDSICFVAEEKGKLIGYLAAAPKPILFRKSRYLEVDNMGVLPRYRSQGVGKLLIESCKQWAKENSYQRLFVTSYSKNKKAITFYKNCGFETIDTSLEITL